MSRCLRQSLLGLLMGATTWATAVADESPMSRKSVGQLIAELELQEAEQKLSEARGQDVPLLRARLALYRADCDGAAAILSSPSLRETEQGSMLFDLARRCAGATASSTIVHDEKRGVWIRLQDDADRVLVPFIVDSVERARATLEKDLGVDLPRPLRIDLVRDLFSLAAVSGLPLSAAETTGTVAVARWGRVTIVSPRATQLGYPWQDTLAHEIVHLLLSRGSADRAPLWLQEGVAKREETRWRPPRPFDRQPDPDDVAWRAHEMGRSVGIDAIGPSIAMLPTPEEASIAFAEVASFMGYWLDQNEPEAFALLLEDMKVSGSDDQAMRSVTGYSLTEWKTRWMAHLAERASELHEPEPAELTPEALSGAGDLDASPQDLARWMRIGELLAGRGYHEEAATRLDLVRTEAPSSGPLRWLSARSSWLAGGEDVDERLGTLRDVDAVHGAWLALRALRLPKQASEPVADGEPTVTPEAFLEHALAVDPLFADVACEGYPQAMPVPMPDPPLPTDPARRALCEQVRALPPRGLE